MGEFESVEMIREKVCRNLGMKKSDRLYLHFSHSTELGEDVWVVEYADNPVARILTDGASGDILFVVVYFDFRWSLSIEVLLFIRTLRKRGYPVHTSEKPQQTGKLQAMHG